MPRLFKSVSRFEIAAALAPVAMFAAVLTVPVQSDNENAAPPMTFDSMGAMVRDMDRERSLDTMAEYAGLSLDGVSASIDECDTTDVKDRLEHVYTSLQAQLSLTQQQKALRMEREIAVRQARDFELSLREADRSIEAARETALKASLRIEAALSALREQRAETMAELDNAEIAAAVDAALRAAEAALSAPE